MKPNEKTPKTFICFYFQGGNVQIGSEMDRPIIEGYIHNAPQDGYINLPSVAVNGIGKGVHGPAFWTINENIHIKKSTILFYTIADIKEEDGIVLGMINPGN